MQKLVLSSLILAALAGAASAQVSTKVENPIRAELGLYIPTFSGGDKDLGVHVGLGYSFLNYKGLDVAAVARGQFFGASDNGFDADITLQSYGIDVRYRPMKDKFFVGAGLAFASTNVDLGGGFSGDTTKLGYSVEAGYDFTKSLYGVVRYQATTDNNVSGYRGVTVGVGYRF